MLITAISNLHGFLPEGLPSADVLIIAGNVFNYDANIPLHEKLVEQYLHREVSFNGWIARQLNFFDKIIMTWGFADILPYVISTTKKESKLQKIFQESGSLPYSQHRVAILKDKAYQFRSIKFYASPWNIGATNFGFGTSEARLKTDVWPHIPKDTNVLITSEAALGFVDSQLGSQSLTNTIATMTQLKMHVSGTIHRNIVRRMKNGMISANVSYTYYDSPDKGYLPGEAKILSWEIK